jgi:hypothetical protein
MALENLDTADTSGEDVLDENIQSLQEQTVKDSILLHQEQQAISTSNVLEKMETTDSIEEKLEIATEHILNMVGLKQKNISLENFNQKLDSKLSIAQEGVIDTIGKYFVDMITTDKSLLKKLEEAVSLSKEKGLKADEFASNLSIRRTFSARGITKIDGDHAIKVLQSYVKINKEIQKELGKIKAMDDAVAASLKESVFIAKDEHITKVDNLKREMATIASDIEKLSYSGDLAGQGKATVVPLNKNEVSKISNLVKDLLVIEKNGLFNGHSGSLTNTSFSTFLSNFRLLFEQNIRLGGIFAGDVRRATVFKQELSEALRLAAGANVNVISAAASAISYIESSTKK